MFPLKDNIPTDRFPVVTVAIIVANVIVYFFLQKHVGTGLSWLNNVRDDNVVRWGAIPFEFKHPGEHCVLAADQASISCGTDVHDGGPPTYVTAFSAMFMHGGLLHIGGNMLFLWIFGNNVEDSMGPLRFLAFYLLGGIAAAALQVAVSPDSTAPLSAGRRDRRRR